MTTHPSQEDVVEEIEIVTWKVRVIKDEVTKRQYALLVGFDAEGNEYETQSKVYVVGEYERVITDIICTTPTTNHTGETNP